MFNLPLKSITRETGVAIGSKLREVLDVDVLDLRVQWAKCLRIDVTKHLVRGKRVTIEMGESRWINFKYEKLPNLCYNCGMHSHVLKDYPSSSKNPQQKNGDLQYGAWLRGDPIRRGFKDSFKPGTGVEDEGRSWVAAERTKVRVMQIHVVKEKEGCGEDHVPRLDSRGDARPAWEEAKHVSPPNQTRELHEEGKGNTGDEKADGTILLIGERSSKTQPAQPETQERMQWEKATCQGIEPKFKFELAPNQPIMRQEPSLSQYDDEHSLIAILFDQKMGWTSKKLGLKSGH